MGVALATLPAAATAAVAPSSNPWQHSEFRLVGGTRFTLTLSPKTQIPGVDPAIWPKGYRYVCSVTGPVMRHRVNWMRSTNDYADLEFEGLYAKAGSLSFTKLGPDKVYSMYFGMPHQFPRVVDDNVDLRRMIGSGAALSPALGLYDFKVIPYSVYAIIPGYLAPTLPAAALSAKLDVRQGTAAECPPLTAHPGAYFRASK